MGRAAQVASLPGWSEKSATSVWVSGSASRGVAERGGATSGAADSATARRKLQLHCAAGAAAAATAPRRSHGSDFTKRGLAEVWPARPRGRRACTSSPHGWFRPGRSPDHTPRRRP